MYKDLQDVDNLEQAQPPTSKGDANEGKKGDKHVGKNAKDKNKARNKVVHGHEKDSTAIRVEIVVDKAATGTRGTTAKGTVLAILIDTQRYLIAVSSRCAFFCTVRGIS